MTSAPPIILLDRDGVIVRFPGKGKYVTSPRQIRLIPNAAKAIRLLTEAGFEIMVLSNQGCVSRGLVTEAELQEMTELMLAQIRRQGGRIRGVFYCPHQSADNCECKKPKAGLFRKALDGRCGDTGSVYFIGDSQEDVAAGRHAGCRTILVLSGRVSEDEVEHFNPKPDAVKKDLWEAVQWILKKKF